MFLLYLQLKVVKSKKPKDFMKTSYVRKIIGYHFRTLLPFWSLSLEHKILEILVQSSVVSYHEVTDPGRPGNVLTREGDPCTNWNYVEMNLMLETVFPPFPLSHSEPASGAMWSYCMFPWDIGCTYTFKLTKPRSFTLCRSFSVQLASLPLCQMADHLLCVRIYF